MILEIYLEVKIHFTNRKKDGFYPSFFINIFEHKIHIQNF